MTLIRAQICSRETTVGGELQQLAGTHGDEELCEHAAQKTLLIVEDNELNLKLYKDLLQTEGHKVLHTKDGGEAFEIALSVRPDLILMDIQLPEMSGLEITKWLKQQESTEETPVIAVTSSAMKGDEERIREGGCDGYMAIPISVATFLETIARFLGSDSGPSDSPAALRMAKPRA
jgi:two-component system cell cycle response regulator DivK